MIVSVQVFSNMSLAYFYGNNNIESPSILNVQKRVQIMKYTLCSVPFFFVWYLVDFLHQFKSRKKKMHLQEDHCFHKIKVSRIVFWECQLLDTKCEVLSLSLLPCPPLCELSCPLCQLFRMCEENQERQKKPASVSTRKLVYQWRARAAHVVKMSLFHRSP